MRFLADMGISMRVVDWLRRNGHDAVHLREEGLERLRNGEIFEKAVRENRIVLTFDLDFGEIVALSHGAKVPVVVFRLHNTRAAHVVDRLSAILREPSLASNVATVVLVEESRHRIRRFPFEIV